MCGVAGLVNFDRDLGAESVSAVLRMIDAEVHRGPDDWGILLPDFILNDPNLTGLLQSYDRRHIRTYPGAPGRPFAVLGARRLSILDLSVAGRMPMGTADGKVWITYNGEIYNFCELRNELCARGYTFNSGTDTEVILNGYLEWGTDVVTHLRGMFAFGIWDCRTRPALFLAKDRFGIKPLYWIRERGSVIFASEVRSCLASSLVERNCEPRALRGFLTLGSVPTPWTTIRYLYSLPAAHTLSIDDRSYSIPAPRRYWDVPSVSSTGMSLEDSIAKTKALLDDSLRHHLVSDVPLGVFLSGGMDSSIITKLAAKYSASQLTTITASFEDELLSEGKKAAELAANLGTRHINVHLDHRDFTENLDRIVQSMDQPSVDGVNTYFVAKAAYESGLKVVLSGLGGDEIFWGYSHFKRMNYLSILSRPPLRTAAAILGDFANKAGRARLGKLKFLRLDGIIGPYCVLRGLFTPSEVRDLLDCDGPFPLEDLKPQQFTAETLGRLEIELYLQNQLLRDTDVFSMAHSVEVRVPFLDHLLVEHVCSVPGAYKLSRNIQKPLLARSASDGNATASLVSKKGFTLPMHTWLRNTPTVMEVIDKSPLDLRASRKLASEFKAGRSHWSRLWAAFVISASTDQRLLADFASDGQRRKILFLASDLYSSVGGIQAFNRNLARALVEATPSLDLTIISLNDRDTVSDRFVRGRANFIACRGHRFPAAYFGLRAAAETFRMKPDLVIAGHMSFSAIAFFLKLCSGRNWVLVAHGVESWNPKNYQKYLASKAAGVLAVSNYTASRIIAWGVNQRLITRLPNTVDGEVFREIREKRNGPRPVIITTARIDEVYKGISTVIRALAKIKTIYPEVKYRIVGPSRDITPLSKLARTCGVERHVEFVGQLTDSELPLALNSADLFVMPSAGEGFGIVFLEAMACGIPVIAGNKDGSVEALLNGQLGRLVDPNDEGALVTAVLEAIGGGDRHLDSQYVRRRVIDAYGFDRFRNRVSGFLNSLGSWRE